MFKLELSAHDALWLGKVLIDHIIENDDTGAVNELWNQLRSAIEKGI
jgi:hypothetical protein